MKDTLLSRRAFATGTLALALGAPLALAQPTTMNAPGGVEFVTGGITSDEADQLRRRSDEFPLEVTFARRMDVGNAFAADIHVRLVDATGRTVLEVPTALPILLANVPPGRYTVEATYDGQTRRQAVNVGRGHTQITMLW